MVSLGLRLKVLCDTIPGVYYSNNHGYLQTQVDNELLGPGNYPGYVPFAGGDINKDTPKEMMEHQGQIDAIHPSGRGYYLLSKRLIEGFIK